MSNSAVSGGPPTAIGDRERVARAVAAGLKRRYAAEYIHYGFAIGSI